MPTSAMIAIIVILLLGAVARSINWRDLAVKWVGNNPARAQVYIKAGGDIYTVQGKRTHIEPKGQTYAFEDKDGKKTVVLPGPGTKRTPLVEYPYLYIRGRRVVGIEDGQLVASPLGFMALEDKRKYAEGLTEVSAIIEGQTFVQAVRSIKRSKAGGISTWLLVGVVVLAAGFYWYMNYGPGAEDVSPVPAVPEQQLPPDMQDSVPLSWDNGGSYNER